ncbi:hypothetical protein D3C86_1941830 [compost metagenome]
MPLIEKVEARSASWANCSAWIVTTSAPSSMMMSTSRPEMSFSVRTTSSSRGSFGCSPICWTICSAFCGSIRLSSSFSVTG